jgi:hypothetical protein
MDVVVFVPLVPAMPVLATWWLPWERWLPKYVPKQILGPYTIYASFAAWYFSMPWWVVLIAVIFGLTLSVIAIIEVMDKRAEASRNHPLMQEGGKPQGSRKGRPRNPLEGRGKQAYESAERKHSETLSSKRYVHRHQQNS